MKYLILNEIYGAFLLYYLFLSFYIFKYIVIIDGQWGGYGKSASNREFLSSTRIYLCGDGDGDGDVDGFGGGDGDGKAIPGSPRCNP